MTPVSMVYVGPIKHLQGKRALVRTGGAIALAQFDDRLATRSGKPIPLGCRLAYEPHARFPVEVLEVTPDPPRDALGFGWHIFSAKDFKQ